MPRVRLLKEENGRVGRDTKWWFRLLFRVSISIALGLWLYHLIDVSASFHQLREVRWPILAGAIFLLTLTHSLNCLRWYLCLLDEGKLIKFRTITISYWTSLFIGMILPSEYGGDMLRAKDVWDRVGDGSAAIASVVWNRVSGIGASLFVFVLVGMARPARLSELSMTWPWAICAATCIGVTIIMISGRVTDLLERLRESAALPTRLREGLTRVASRFVALATHRTVALRVAGLAVLMQAVMILTNTLYAWSLDHRVTVFDMALVVPLVTFSSMLPVSIAGIGVKEGAFVLFLSAVGLSPEAALAVALLNRLVQVAFAVSGGLFFPFRQRLLES